MEGSKRVGAFHFVGEPREGWSSFSAIIYQEGKPKPIARVKGPNTESEETYAQALRICEMLDKGHTYQGYTHPIWWVRFTNPVFWESLWRPNGPIQ